MDDLTVDLSDLWFADSSVMLDLAMLARRLRLRGKQLVLQGAQPHVERLIEIVGMQRLPGIVIAGAAA